MLWFAFGLLSGRVTGFCCGVCGSGRVLGTLLPVVVAQRPGVIPFPSFEGRRVESKFLCHFTAVPVTVDDFPQRVQFRAAL